MPTTTEQNLVKVSQCNLGDTIKFKTINPIDVNVYSGKIIGIVDFERARTYGDVAAIHLQMAHGASSMGKDDLIDVTQQQFLVVELYNGEIVPYAFEWLQSPGGSYGSVQKIDVGATYTIRLYNVSDTDASTALSILKQNGYVCKLLKKTRDGSVS